MSDTLVLDTLGFPVAFVSWQRAINLQWQDRAVVVTEDAKRILRSPSFEMGMPRVIKLRNHISRKLRLKVPMTRRNIAIRDNSSCQYCGVVLETAEYTIDHVLPRARGGSSVWTNLALACVQCNKRKSDRTPQEAGLTLRQKPMEPNQFDPRFNFRLHIHLPRARGGSSVWTNLALACVQCNKRKSDRTPQEAGLTLRQKPMEPNQFDPKFNFRLHIHALRPEWSDYKAYIYWNVELEK